MVKTTSFDWDHYISELVKDADKTFWGFLGCEMIELSQKQVVISLDVKDHHLNLLHILHGGVHASMLDNAMGLVTMAARPQESTVTTNLNIHFMSQIKKQHITVYADIIHESKTMLTTQGRIEDEHGKVCTIGTGSFRVIK
ncbi:PaaI family thioesterase [Radiobacillus deserti]|uniref:PaaI family thioesterase n=1 Tax=Radiobacillus deserti TaxID=2594883 RepID=A0A516KKG7_9BACI|nr:PaaI family thioesterase [Radiobacillus deserti]QDP41893.1 PaaI family thioesterase [Radiobacillus deserti]